jgi:hypothetical protein
MAYEDTSVSVAQSQGAISKLLEKHRVHSQSISTSRHPVRTEGVTFQLDDPLTKRAYLIKIVAHPTNDSEQETRRIWRVLFYHIKTMFESLNSKVMTFEQVFLPFVVTTSGKTVAEEMHPKFAELGAPLPQLMGPKK